MLPESIQPLLNEYMTQIDEKLPNFVTNFYLHGSVALNAFDERFSDVDFIAVISRPASDQEVDVLSEIHQRVAQNYPRPALEGTYLLAVDIGKFGNDAPVCVYHHDRQVQKGQFELNPVTWWVLQHHGITLKGDAPRLNITEDKLLGWMKQNFNTYWRGWTRFPRFTYLMFDDAIQWMVLGVLRQVYTFRKKQVTSKTGAGEYALQHLPSGWHRIIREALNIRAQKRSSLYRFRIARAVESYRFLRYVLHAYG